jgi:hypothetical protein
MAKSFSLKNNPYLFSKKPNVLSNLSSHCSTMKLKTNKMKNSESFSIRDTPDMMLSGTLKKILSKAQRARVDRNGKLQLKKFVSQEVITCPLTDQELIEKITFNKNKLKFDKEMRELYRNKSELKEIPAQPIFPHYIGHRFRKCYQETLSKQKEYSSGSTLPDNEQKVKNEKLELIQQSSAKDEVRDEQIESGETTYMQILPELTPELESIHHQHLIESLQSYQYLNDLTIPEVPPQLCEDDKFTREEGKKLLVFDMDETLIHCISEPKEDTVSEVKIPYKYEKELKYKYVNLRPFVVE